MKEHRLIKEVLQDTGDNLEKGVGLSRQRVGLLARPQSRKSPGEKPEWPPMQIPPTSADHSNGVGRRQYPQKISVSLLSLPPRPENIC